jgi:bifunctional non-homologous end joining protein LigD
MAGSPSILARRRKNAGDSSATPALVEPMLAVPSDLPSDAAKYAFEWKWDGVRAMCYYDRGRAEGPRFTLRSRNQIDITSRYPELAALPAALRCRQAILDGEIVAMDDIGRPSFALLQRRMHVGDPPPALRKAVPALYVIFDILYRDGQSLLERPLSERRKCLEAVVADGPYWQMTSSHGSDAAAAMLEAARQNGLEGVVAKRLDSRYEPGKRSPAWRKVKVIQRQEFVVGGWVPEEGGRGDRIGSMLLGYYDASGALRYAGRVGTGLNDADHARLLPILRSRHRGTSPFSEKVPGTNVRFLAPEVVVEVEFRRWSEGGRLQHGAFKGVRFDKEPRRVVKERPS